MINYIHSIAVNLANEIGEIALVYNQNTQDLRWRGDLAIPAIEKALLKCASGPNDLLGELIEIEQELTVILCRGFYDSTSPQFYAIRQCRDEARSAIAKARGEA